MAGITPGFDHPAGGAIEITVGDDCQAGIGGDVAARLIQRQPGNVTENTVQNSAVCDGSNFSAPFPGDHFFEKGNIALKVLSVAFTSGQDVIRVIGVK